MSLCLFELVLLFCGFESEIHSPGGLNDFFEGTPVAKENQLATRSHFGVVP